MTARGWTMPNARSRRRREERGFALVVVLIATLLLSAIAAALHIGVLGETRLRGAHARATAGFYAAEAGINRGMGDYRNIFLAYHQPNGSDFDEQTLFLGPRTVRYRLQPACPGGCPLEQQVPAGRPFAGLRAQVYKYVANATSELHAGDVETSLGTEFQVNYIPLFQFLAFYEGDLEINPGPSMTLNGPIHTNGSLYLNSNDTLSIEDNPPLITTVSVTATGSVFRGRKDDQNSPKCGGTVRIDKLADTNLDGSLDSLTMPCTGGTATSQSDAALSPWLGAVKARQPRVSVPEPDVLQRGTGAYWQLADLRIALDLNNPESGYFPIVVLGENDATDVTRTARLHAFMTARPGRIFYNDVPAVGQDLTTSNCSTLNTYCERRSYEPDFTAQNQVYACAGSDLGLYGACAPLIANVALSGGRVTARRGGFYNNREQAWVYMLNVNLRDLLAWNRLQPAGNRLIDDPDDNTEGGLVIFLTVKGPASTGALPAGRRYGVRVFGSPNLNFPPSADPTGVTVVSDQAIYLEGHYNVRPGHTLYNAAFPKQPAAFMGDTINVLSANWSGDPNTGWTPGNACRNDCQSRRALAQRPAVATQINAAFLGGVDVTIPGDPVGYNGGFENYPRFHEDWSGLNLTYRGSFVSLGRPQRASGRWCGTGGSLASGCNIYNPPNRLWNYDTDFQQVANLPPLTPRVVSVEQILFTENFR